MNQLDKDNLIKAAQIASGNSRAFKSNFYVGAALRVEEAEKGRATKIVTGANIEFEGSPAIHAEIAALTKLICSGIREHDVTAMAIWTQTGPHSSCGACRQALLSHLSEDVEVIFAGGNGTVETTLGELLPNVYTRERN